MPRLKVLVVDDSATVRAVVMAHFARIRIAEFEFLQAEDGVDALEKSRTGDVDLVVVDWMMPRMDGLEFLGRIRRTAWGATLPVVMITAQGRVSDMEEVVGAVGECVFIPKPFTSGYLLGRLEPLVERILDHIAAAAPTAPRR